MNCVVMAGGRPQPSESLYTLTKGGLKACLKIGEKSVLEWVIAALQEAPSIEQILVVGLDEQAGLTFKKPVQWLPIKENLVTNGLAAAAWVQQNWADDSYVLFCGGDIPALNGAIVERFIEECQPLDKALYYTMVRQEVMERRFPGSKRTFVRFSDQTLAGGDMIIARPELAQENRQLLDSLAQGRKHAWQIARMVGPVTLFRFLVRRLSIKEAEETGTRLFGQPVKVILSNDAELAMDLDKPEHFAILRGDLDTIDQSRQ
jgi:molybdopterin-guanine dinucleotide biosynthesis protein A